MGECDTDVFRSCDTSIVSDALDEHGIDGVITGLEPVGRRQTLVGRAHTIRLERTPTPGSETNFPYAMLEELVADRVLVLEGVGPELSCWGGNASRLAANAGAEGIVIDGGYRDVGEIRNGAFPVFGRAPTPKTGQRRIAVDAVGEPVEIGGVEVAPDDLLVADATGVVAVPADVVPAVAATAETILEEERAVERKIDAGVSVSTLERDDHQF